MMRLDPGLCFLARCGPPDNAAVQAELEGTKPPLDDHLDDDDEDSNSATPQSSRPPSTKPEENNEGGLKQFPDGSALNSRLRRLVTSYQREYKKEEARQQAKDKRNERRERRLGSRQRTSETSV